MFDVLSFAADNHVEVSVRPGSGRVLWEIFLRDRSRDLAEFTQIKDYEVAGLARVDSYIEQRCERMLRNIRGARSAAERTA
ncbi:MAG: hypothetical protein IKG66_06165 [Lachnospiraceae bacterium]|nr:hypothetical protein [Lachnospiraceae bacterium]